MKPIIFCDFDGTITQVDVTDLILAELAQPSWREVEQEWVEGRLGSRECLERQMALVGASEKELNTLLDSVAVDPHFEKFYRFARRRAIPFYVLSDGFDYVIRRVLSRAGIDGELRNGTRLFSSSLEIDGRRLVTSFPHQAPQCNHGCATCKAEIIRRLGGGHHPVVYIGDGLSDRFAVEESTLVFAKQKLAEYCRERGRACREFETFAEVERAFRELVGKPPRRTREVVATTR